MIYILFLLFSAQAFAGQGLNVYSTLAALGEEEAGVATCLAGGMGLVLCLVVGFFFKRSVERRVASGDLAPSANLGVVAFSEGALSFLYNLTRDQCGKSYHAWLPFMSTLFLYILFSNISGLVPGFPPVTEQFSANLALGLLVFFAYNAAGIKEHGLSYIKQFCGPFLVLAPMFLVLEGISHAARPLSLAFRLTANIFGDHLVHGIFSSLCPLLVPTLLLFFGLLVGFIQSFVFVLLSGIYVNMAISHDH